MSQHKAPKFTQPFTLEPIDLRDEDHVEELIQQRKICGWSHELKAIHGWRDQVEAGTKYFWWVTVAPPPPPPPTTTSSSLSNGHPTSGTTSQRSKRAGHIALSSETSPPHPELARLDRSILTVNTFFIMPEYRSLGLGRAVWLKVEDKARQIPECKQISIDTWDARYVLDKGPEWGGLLKTLGIEITNDVVNEEWYTRMGYEKFMTVPRYPLPGTDRLMVSVFLRKFLK